MSVAPLFDEPKRCVDCGQPKPLSAFSPNRFKRDGRQPYCTPCGTDRVRRSRGVRGVIPPKPSVCEVCGGPGGQRGLNLDHDHTTGEPRGWLCFKCNSLIGLAGDQPGVLEAAASYLRHSGT